MTRKIKYYDLKPVYNYDEEFEKGMILRTAAVISCSLCSKIIDGMGGPGNSPICLECKDVLSSGQLRNVVIYDKK